MFDKSAILKFLCLSLSVILTKSQVPFFIESRPPPPTIVTFPQPSFASYGQQVPFVSASVKSPPVIVQPAPAPAPVPLPPVTRARIGVKTIFRPPPPAPIKVLPPAPAPFIEQQEVIGEPEPYNFNFDVKDDSGNGQFRREEGDTRGVVRGSYGYTDAYGLYRIVDYVADKDGFRASIRSNEPGLVEPNPVSGVVPNPAHITLAAEETPGRVKDLIRLIKPAPYDGRIRSIRAPSNDISDKYSSKDF